MTIFISTCFAFAVIRCIEEFVRFCISLISRLTTKKKSEVVLQKRISAYVSPEVHGLVKSHAQLLGLTISDYILIAVTEKVKRGQNGL